MKLYIANCTQQVHDFVYRMLESGALRQQKIEAGGQIAIAGDLTSPEVDYIIEQHRRYGLVRVDEIDQTKPFIGLCFQTDRPIAVDKIRRALIHNREVLEDRGRQLRKEAAIAQHNRLQDQTVDGSGAPIGPPLTALEMSVVEEKAGQLEDHTPIAEGLRVTTKEGPGGEPPTGRRRGRKAA